MKQSISSGVRKLLGAMCLLIALLAVNATSGYAQSREGSTPAPAKPAKLDTKVERDERSEREKREELGRKLERRRNELNSTPTNSLMPNDYRPAKTQEGTRNSSESKEKDKK